MTTLFINCGAMCEKYLHTSFPFPSCINIRVTDTVTYRLVFIEIASGSADLQAVLNRCCWQNLLQMSDASSPVDSLVCTVAHVISTSLQHPAWVGDCTYASYLCADWAPVQAHWSAGCYQSVLQLDFAPLLELCGDTNLGCSTWSSHSFSWNLLHEVFPGI